MARDFGKVSFRTGTPLVDDDRICEAQRALGHGPRTAEAWPEEDGHAASCSQRALTAIHPELCRAEAEN